MFNVEGRVALAEFSSSFDRLIRPGSFFSVGKIPSRVPARLVPLKSKKFVAELEKEIASIAGVICTPDLVDYVPEQVACATSSDPVRSAFFIHSQLCERPDYLWTDFESQIADDAQVHPRAFVAEKNVVIGSGTVVGPNAAVMERTVIGADCRIGAGTAIGSEASEMIQIEGRNRLQVQGGGVWIGDRVVFGVNSCISRCVYPTYTSIGDDCYVDGLVYVAHDCVLEKNCMIAGLSVLSGRVELKEGVYVAPGSTISNGISIGSNATVTIGSTVVRNVASDGKVAGNFAIDHEKFLRLHKSNLK